MLLGADEKSAEWNGNADYNAQMHLIRDSVTTVLFWQSYFVRFGR